MPYASRVQPPAFGRARTESNFRHTDVLLRPSVQSQVTGGCELSTWGVLSRVMGRREHFTMLIFVLFSGNITYLGNKSMVLIPVMAKISPVNCASVHECHMSHLMNTWS